MNKIIIATAFAMTFVSSTWAAETVNIHERVNNAQAPAHQMMSSTPKSAVDGVGTKMMDMDEHQKAVVAHETVNNSNSDAHKKMAEQHKKMMGEQGVTDAERKNTKSFSQMDEHEKAAIAHETVKNAQSSAHKEQAEQHRSMMQSN